MAIYWILLIIFKVGLLKQAVLNVFALNKPTIFKNLWLMKRLFYLLFLGFFLYACNTHEDKRKLDVFSASADTILINYMHNFHDFFNNNNLTIHFSHISFRLYSNQLYIGAFSVERQYFYIYNCMSSKLIKYDMSLADIPECPVYSVYLHSPDSIFILFVDEQKTTDNRSSLSSLILYDSLFHKVREYDLSGIPYFFSKHGPSLIENNLLTYQSRIIDDSLLLFPMAIYSPAPEDTDFLKFQPNQLCFINLKNGNIQMLHAGFPITDIGKQYDENVLTTVIYFTIINSDSIIYSFPYSPDIYLLNTRLNISTKIDSDKNAPFVNETYGSKRDSLVIRYEPLIYSKTKDLYFRQISISKKPKSVKKVITEMLSPKLKHIGYVNSQLFCVGLEPFLNDNNHIGHPVDIVFDTSYRTNDFINKIFEDDSSIVDIKLNKDFCNLPINDKMRLYLNDMGFKDSLKLVIINTDMMCASCVDFLMSVLSQNQYEFNKRRIYYLFIGEDINIAINLLSNYQIKTHVNFDIELKYKKYFLSNEVRNFRLIDITETNISIDSAEYLDFYPKIINFLELDVEVIP